MKKEEIRSAVIIVDGGCKGNGSEGAKSYGSYAVVINETVLKLTPLFDLPTCSTNNQAEYGAMLMAMNYAKEYDKYDLPFEFITDSILVVAQVLGDFKLKQPELLKPCQDIRNMLKKHPL